MAESLVRRVYEEGGHLALDIELKIPEALEKQESGTDLSASNAQTEEKGMLRQVLLNIVGNVIKFTEEGEATIHIEVLQKK